MIHLILPTSLQISPPPHHIPQFLALIYTLVTIHSGLLTYGLIPRIFWSVGGNGITLKRPAWNGEHVRLYSVCIVMAPKVEIAGAAVPISHPWISCGLCTLVPQWEFSAGTQVRWQESIFISGASSVLRTSQQISFFFVSTEKFNQPWCSFQ